MGWNSTPTTTNIIIENNRFKNFGQTEYDHALYLAGGVENAIVRNNYFYGFNAGVPLHNFAKDRPTSKNTLIYNNVFVLAAGPNRTASYVANNDNIRFFHNTFYVKWESSTSYLRNQLIRMVNYPQGATRGKFWNNIVYHIGNTDPSKLIFGASSQHNLFYPQADPDDVKYAVVADPKFVDVKTGNFRLRSDSPAIDRGRDTGGVRYDYDRKARPRGGGYDIGAFEY